MNKFKLDETQIYKYHDGYKVRAIDPLDAVVKLQKENFEWETVAKLCETGDSEAIESLVNHVRKIFDLKEIELNEEGDLVGGVSSTHVLEVLMGLTTFLDSLKKNNEETVISTPATEDANQLLTVSS